MAGDEQLRIDVEVVGGKEAINTLGTLSAKVKEASDLIEKSGWSNKEIQTLNKELSSITKSMSDYAKAIQTVNDVNSKAAMNEQKLANEVQKANSAIAMSKQKMATEAAKASGILAISEQKVATEIQRQGLLAVRTEMQNLRLAQAQEKAALAAEKAARPYNQLNKALQDQANKLKDAIAKGNLNDYTLGKMADKYKRLQRELTEVNAKFHTLTGTQAKTLNGGRLFASFLGNLAANVIQNAISSFDELIRKMSQAAVQMDGIRNTFAAGARGWKQGGEEMEFVAEMADRLGLNLKATYEPYAKFMTSFTRSGGTIEQSRQIFEDLSVAMVSLHLPAEKMEGVFVALEQMANKGTVQAEELKRQLANALPGAFELAAESMGILPAELMDMMKKGQVVSKDFLPKFASTVKDALGGQIGIAVDQYNAHLNRLQSQTWLAQANLGTAWNNASLIILKPMTEILKGFNAVMGSFSKSAGATTILQTAFVVAGAAAITFVGQFGMVNTALTVMKANAIAAAKALWGLAANPVGATLLALGAAALYCANSVNKANQEFAEAAVQQRDVTNNVVGLINEYSALSQITNKSTAQQEAYNRTMETLSSEYPEILQYIRDHGINLQNLTQDQADNIASMAVQAKMREAEKLMMDELSNKWLIFGTRCKQVGMGVVLVLQGIGAAVVDVAVAMGQVFTRAFSLIVKSIGWVWEQIAKGARAVHLDEIADSYDSCAKSAQNLADKAWNVGKATHEYVNGGLALTVEYIKQLDLDRQAKATTRYKDTVAILGQEQQKLANNLIQTKHAVEGLNKAGDGKKGKTAKTKTAKTKEPDSEWDKLVKEIAKKEEQIKVNELLGRTDNALIEDYIKLKKRQDEITKSVADLTSAKNKEVTAWKDLKKAAQEATAIYENRISHSLDYTAAEIEEARVLAKNINAQVKYADALKNTDNFVQITTRNASKLADTLIDGLFEPLKEGENIWTRFKDAGVSAIKSIATEWLKNKANLMLMGAQAGWAQNGSGNRFVSALLGMGSAVSGSPLEGTKDNPTYGRGTGILNGALNRFKGVSTGAAADISGVGSTDTGSTLFSIIDQQALGLADTINNMCTPSVLSFSETLLDSTGTAITDTVTGFGQMTEGAMSAGSSLLGVANPAITTAQSIASMAMSAPIAASSVGALAGVMTTASTAFTAAAPALTTMATAMAGLATSASTAATSMAALAVATAAESVAKIPFVGGFLAPIAALATGAAIAGGTILTGAGIGASSALAGAGNMVGGAMSGLGNKMSGISGLTGKTNVIPHAKGGIVSSPTMFPMQGGNVGVAGEAGTEVIAPARRMSNGDLGIGAVQPNVTVNNYTNAAVEVIKRPDNSTEIKISELNAMLSSSKTNRGFTSAQSRVNARGRQVG